MPSGLLTNNLEVRWNSHEPPRLALENSECRSSNCGTASASCPEVIGPAACGSVEDFPKAHYSNHILLLPREKNKSNMIFAIENAKAVKENNE
ncbi:hypothetical protein GN956_G9925 [Arapaima gigas]